MRLDIPQNDDARHVQREPRRGPAPEPPRQEPLIEPGPLDRRIRELAARAEQPKFPEIPRRQYEQKPVADVRQPDREPGERHVRSRHHLPHAVPGLRLHQEERQLLYETGRFRVLSLKDAAQSIYSGDERALRSDLRYLKEQGLVSVGHRECQA